jgi:hypothetical protein
MTTIIHYYQGLLLLETIIIYRLKINNLLLRTTIIYYYQGLLLFIV